MSKNNLRLTNMCMSGNLNLKHKISNEMFKELIYKFDWMNMSDGENYAPRYSKSFYIRDKEEISVHHKRKAPYVTIFAKGGIIIVGLKSRQEANKVWDLVIKDLKKSGVKL